MSGAGLSLVAQDERVGLNLVAQDERVGLNLVAQDERVGLNLVELAGLRRKTPIRKTFSLSCILPYNLGSDL